MSTVRLPAPPAAAGALTIVPGPRELARYLDELVAWRAQLLRALDELDRSSAPAPGRDTFTAELTVAMTLAASVDRRTDELLACRADPEAASPLLWSGLPDPYGRPSPFTLTEAGTLVCAVVERLGGRLDAVGAPAAPVGADEVRAALARCRALAASLEQATPDIAAGEAELDHALRGPTAGDAAVTVTRIAATASGWERDLIKLAGTRTAVAAARSSAERRARELAATAAAVQADAQRTAERIAGVGDADFRPTTLGPVPVTPPASAGLAAWQAARTDLGEYARRQDELAAELAAAAERVRAPRAERDALRGLLTAYQAKAAAAGLVRDAALTRRFEAARGLLWSAPCDLTAARELAFAYVRLVQDATRGRAEVAGR